MAVDGRPTKIIREKPMAATFKGFALAACAAGALLAGAQSGAAQEPEKPNQIVVNASGGAMNDVHRRVYFTPFEESTGIQIIDTSPVDFGKLRAMVESQNIEWTVTELGGQDGLRAARMDLLEPIDPDIVDRSKFPEEAQDPYTFASSVYSTVLGYSTEAFQDGNQPKNWAEFWDVEQFPGPRSMRNHPVDNLEFALLADGVPLDELYPLDMDRAFSKLDEIKPHVTVWWTTGAQPAQMLLDGEVVLATGWNGRFFDLIKQDAPLGIEWAGGSLKLGTFGIPKGAENAYWGQRFLAVMTDPELQAKYANELGYPGLNLDSIQYVDPEVAPHLPTYADNLEKQFWLSIEWWTDNGEEAGERWNRWMLSN
jgi:putative spermidine/putrescine transport system substrate-binding protein